MSGTLIGYFDPTASVACLSGDLPHWRQDGVTYFVTFRLADSLPQEQLRLWHQERKEWLAAHPEPHDLPVRREYYERFPQRLQDWLDAGAGSCILRLPQPKAIVDGALRHFAGTRYSLDEHIVACNHVHVLVTPLASHSLSNILHTWKSFTAHRIAGLRLPSQTEQTRAGGNLGRSSSTWQKESFDHIVRGPDSLERFRQYIRGHSR